MASLKKRPVFVALLLCLVAVSSFAVSYSILAKQDGGIANAGYAVLGGSCCPSEGETTVAASASSCALEVAAPTSSLEVSAQTVAAKEEAADSCCSLTSKAQTVANSCDAEKTACDVDDAVKTANADKVTQTQVASVQ